MRIALNEWILGMRLPWPQERVGIVETQRVVLEGRTAHKHPPFPIRTKQRWVSVLPGEHLAHTRPGGWEVNGSIDPNSLSFQRLRHHVIGVLPLEHVGVRQVKRFLQDNTSIAPVPPIVTRSQTDHTALPLGMHHLEEHVPGLSHLQQKRIGDEGGGNIGDVGCSQHRVVRHSPGNHTQWRGPGVDANRPDILRCHEWTLTPPAQYATLALAAFTRRSISSSVKPAILRASREILIDT